MIGELIRMAFSEKDRAYYEGQMALNLGGIAIGTGPSFFEWKKKPLTPGIRYGCGIASCYMSLDVYCINAGVHRKHIPYDGTPVFAKDRCKDFAPNCFVWPETWPIAQQAGGMCVHLAAMNHSRVGLVGFCNPITPEIDDQFREILKFWIDRGRVFVSLMKESVFDDLLEKGYSEV